MGELKNPFDKEKALEMINKLRAASQEFSQANTFTSSKTTHKCPKCKDEEGYIVKVPDIIVRNGETLEIMRDAWKFCECKEERSIERTFKTSKITLEFQKKNFDAFSLENRPASIRQAYQMARIYANGFDKIRETRSNSICMLGNVGSGKTHLLAAVANDLMSLNIKVLYFPWVEGFNEIKDDLSLTEERINRMQKVDLLFIDDMWKGRKEPTPFQIEQAFAVINYRYMEKLPVLISSERDIDQMCDIDEAIGSRINEMCKDFRIILKGGREMNYRLREDEGA
jgi:DNA replication protein DnaC